MDVTSKNRDKASLDIFWLRDESLEESDNLPDPDVLAEKIVEDLEAALEQFRKLAGDLIGSQRKKRHTSRRKVNSQIAPEALIRYPGSRDAG